MSSIYMDVLKDRMYCDGADSLSRRSAQTAMYKILDCLVRMLAPILVHTAEEVWETMKTSCVMRDAYCEKEKTHDAIRNTQYEESIHLADMPKVDGTIDWQSDEPRWQKLMGLRDKVLVVLEPLRKDKVIGSNQESSVTIRCDADSAAVIEKFGIKNFAALCIVSEVKLEKSDGQMQVSAKKSPHSKCQRCWNYWPSVGADSNHPDLCERCVSVIRRVGL
jgi:isoleucyl-tRNA synthetase